MSMFDPVGHQKAATAFVVVALALGVGLVIALLLLPWSL